MFLAGLAIRMLGKNHLVVSFMKDFLRTDLLGKVLPSITNALRSVPGLAARAGVEGVTSVASKGLIENSSKGALSIGVTVRARNFSRTGAKLGKRAARGVGGGAKTGAKAAGFIIGVSAAFIVLDAIDLAFTVRDIVKDEGSDAARCLRCKADEYEAILLNQ